MKRERILEAKIVRSRNDLVDCLEKEEIVIFVEGDLYEKMKKELVEPKQSKKLGKINLGLGMASMFVGAPVVAVANVGIGMWNMLSGASKDQIKKYNLKNNKEFKRIELYLAKGQDKYNKELDAISNYDKKRYTYEEWWEGNAEEKIHKREEVNNDDFSSAERKCIISENLYPIHPLFNGFERPKKK